MPEGEAATVSIIVPAFNAMQTLDTCVASLVNQTYENIQLIIVDDGSTDGTSEHLDELSATYSQLNVIHQENAGLPTARRVGFLASIGEYVLFVDSDDWIEPETVETMLSIALKTGVDVVSCNVCWDYEGRRKSHVQGPIQDRLYESEDGILRDVYCHSAVFQYVWNKLYRREVIHREDFSPISTMGEDYFTVLEIFQRVSSCYHVAKPFYHYFHRVFSMVLKGFSSVHREAYELFRHYEEMEIKRYPAIRDLIECYTTYELLLLIVLAMPRNSNYDWQLVDNEQKRCRNSFRMLLSYGGVGVYEKCALTLFSIHPKAFFSLYYIIYYIILRRHRPE
jgi:glycosyltransferase involved in cell wall biosynthesis